MNNPDPKPSMNLKGLINLTDLKKILPMMASLYLTESSSAEPLITNVASVIDPESIRSMLTSS